MAVIGAIDREVFLGKTETAVDASGSTALVADGQSESICQGHISVELI